MSARDGALETADPAADRKPSGMSASSALIDARRTRPESELSPAVLGRSGGGDSFAACMGEKVGSGISEDMMSMGEERVEYSETFNRTNPVRGTLTFRIDRDWAYANLVAVLRWLLGILVEMNYTIIFW